MVNVGLQTESHMLIPMADIFQGDRHSIRTLGDMTSPTNLVHLIAVNAQDIRGIAAALQAEQHYLMQTAASYPEHEANSLTRQAFLCGCLADSMELDIHVRRPDPALLKVISANVNRALAAEGIIYISQPVVAPWA